MFRRFSINFALFSIGLDALLVVISLMGASHMRPLLSFLPFASDVRKPMQLPFLIFPIFLVLWIGIFTLMSVYDGRKNLRVTDEMTSVTMGSLLAGVCSAGMLYLTYRDVSRVLFLAFILIAYLSVAAWRLAARTLFKLAKGRAFSWAGGWRSSTSRSWASWKTSSPKRVSSWPGFQGWIHASRIQQCGHTHTGFVF